MRSEIKIPINKNFDLYFQNWKDFKNKITKQHNDRVINNIYYDTDNFMTAQNNLIGISRRSKYRIRWYNEDNNNFNYEIKIKKNNVGTKIILKSDKNLTNFDDLFSYKNNFFMKKENKYFLNYVNSLDLKPKLKVNYLRSYFLYNNKIRITYDRKINYQLIDRLDIKKNITNDFMNVVEIKFNPDDFNVAANLVKNSKFIPKRFSKYLRGLYLSGLANYI